MNRVIVISLILGASAGAASAQVESEWNASFGVYPDSLCAWRLVDTAFPENAVLAGGKLTLSASPDDELMYYVQQAPDLAIPGTWVIEARLRVVAETHPDGNPHRGVAIVFVPTANNGNVLFLDVGHMFLWSGTYLNMGTPIPANTTDTFHTYRIEISGNSVAVYYDDALALSGGLIPDGRWGNPQVYWGEATGNASGTSEWTMFRHNGSANLCSTLAVNPDSVDFGSLAWQTTVCDTIRIANAGATRILINSITGCSDEPFALDQSMTNMILDPGQSTFMIVCATPIMADSADCVIQIDSTDPAGPTLVPVTIDEVTAAASVPLSFGVTGAVPNPFNPETSIRFTLSERMGVDADIFDVNGAHVRALARARFFSPGPNELRWNGVNDRGEGVSSGVYFVRVRTGAGEKVVRAVLLK
jgi:hypothetical protein